MVQKEEGPWCSQANICGVQLESSSHRHFENSSVLVHRHHGKCTLEKRFTCPFGEQEGLQTRKAFIRKDVCRSLEDGGVGVHSGLNLLFLDCGA